MLRMTRMQQIQRTHYRYLSPSQLPSSSLTSHHERRHPYNTRSTHYLSRKKLHPPSADLEVLGARFRVSKLSEGRNHWLNLASLSKIVGNLNLDFPKEVAWSYLKLLPLAVWKSHALENEPDKKLKEAASAQKFVVEQQEDLRKDAEKVSDSQKDAERLRLIAQLRMKAHHMVEREQHDFGQAMMSAYETTQLKVGETDLSSKVESHPPKTVSITSSSNLVRSISQLMPSMKSNDKPKSDSVVQKDEAQQRVIIRKENLARGSADRKTKGLVLALRASTSNISRVRRLEELCKHLAEFPSTRGKAVKEKAIPCLLKLRDSRDQAISELSMEALALVGYVDPVKGRGIRILCLDGGGTRGLITIQILKYLQKFCGQELHKMFDYVCGVSTGSLLAVMLAAFRVPLPETELLYREYSSKMFSRNKLKGVGKLFMSHAYYDAELWEQVLHESIGFKTFLETTRDPECPKLSLVSSVMNVAHLQNYLFRNYVLPPGVLSHFPGSHQFALWQAIRASSAAPGYFEDLKLGEWVHQDGGIITNNPTAIALHECRLLWPKEKIQCVVSVGTGKYMPGLEAQPADTSSLKQKLTKIVQSATDTEAVHTTLHDLLPPSSYFRLNPYMSEDFQLDEIRTEKWDRMAQDTEMYCRKNDLKIKKAAETLLKTRMPHQKVTDWVKKQKELLS